MGIQSPRSKAMSVAVGRRMGFAVLRLCARAICATSLLACSIGALVLSSGLVAVAMWPLTRLHGPVAEPMQHAPWWSIGAWALILAWAVVDGVKGKALFAGVKWSRPMQSALLIVGSGFYFAFDRAGQLLKGLPSMFGVGVQPLPDMWPELPRQATLLGGFHWIALSAKPWGAIARQAIPATLSMSWMLLSGVLAIGVLSPLVLLESVIVHACAKASSLLSVSISDRARQIGDKLVAEGEPALAKAESYELEGAAPATERHEKGFRL